MKPDDLKKIHELVKDDRLDFSEAFLRRFDKTLPEKDRTQLRSDITKYLGENLAKKLKISHIKVPWSQMKADDIINWPLEVDLQSINKMKADDLKKIHQLVKDDRLDFSPEFVSWFENPLSEKKTSVQAQLTSNITKYLEGKLAAKVKRSILPIPWSQIKPGDIINWPSDVALKSLLRMKVDDLKKIHQLVKEGKLEFSPEFLIKYKKLLNIKD
jgi:uncharacterized protein YfkK (UPF0435 family)